MVSWLGLWLKGKRTGTRNGLQVRRQSRNPMLTGTDNNQAKVDAYFFPSRAERVLPVHISAAHTMGMPFSYWHQISRRARTSRYLSCVNNIDMTTMFLSDLRAIYYTALQHRGVRCKAQDVLDIVRGLLFALYATKEPVTLSAGFIVRGECHTRCDNHVNENTSVFGWSYRLQIIVAPEVPLSMPSPAQNAQNSVLASGRPRVSRHRRE